MADSPTDSGTVFISYSHQDAAYLARLQQHLAPYVRSGAIPLWDDTQIKLAYDWKHSIEQALEAARVAVLLISVSFLASEFVTKEELPRLLAVAEARGTRILSVILTPCLFQRTTLRRFQAINDTSRPLSGLSQHEQDLIWERVAETVLDILDESAISEPESETAPARTPTGSIQSDLLPSLPPMPPGPNRRGRIPDKFPDLLGELITSTPGLILNYSTKKYTEFMPREWDVPALEGKNRPLLRFLFDRKSERLQLNMVICPGPLETRQRLLDMAHAKQPPFEPVHRELNNYWNTLYRRLFLTTQEYERSSSTEIQREIRRQWEDFLKRDLPEIQAAVRTEAWIWK